MNSENTINNGFPFATTGESILTYLDDCVYYHNTLFVRVWASKDRNKTFKEMGISAIKLSCRDTGGTFYDEKLSPTSVDSLSETILIRLSSKVKSIGYLHVALVHRVPREEAGTEIRVLANSKFDLVSIEASQIIKDLYKLETNLAGLPVDCIGKLLLPANQNRLTKLAFLNMLRTFSTLYAVYQTESEKKEKEKEGKSFTNYLYHSNTLLIRVWASSERNKSFGEMGIESIRPVIVLDGGKTIMPVCKIEDKDAFSYVCMIIIYPPDVKSKHVTHKYTSYCKDNECFTVPEGIIFNFFHVSPENAASLLYGLTNLDFSEFLPSEIAALFLPSDNEKLTKTEFLEAYYAMETDGNSQLKTKIKSIKIKQNEYGKQIKQLEALRAEIKLSRLPVEVDFPGGKWLAHAIKVKAYEMAWYYSFKRREVYPLYAYDADHAYIKACLALKEGDLLLKSFSLGDKDLDTLPEEILNNKDSYNLIDPAKPKEELKPTITDYLFHFTAMLTSHRLPKTVDDFVVALDQFLKINNLPIDTSEIYPKGVKTYSGEYINKLQKEKRRGNK